MHTDYTMLMSLMLDGEATQADERRLREHLRTCAACAGVWQRWQAVDRRLAAAPLMTPAHQLHRQDHGRIEAQKSKRRRTRWLGSGLLASWLAVSLIGLVVVGVLVYWGSQNPQQASGAFFAVLKGVALRLGSCSVSCGSWGASVRRRWPRGSVFWPRSHVC